MARVAKGRRGSGRGLVARAVLTESCPPARSLRPASLGAMLDGRLTDGWWLSGGRENSGQSGYAASLSALWAG